MIRKYRVFLYKLITMPNTEGMESTIFSTFLGVSLLQGTHLGTIVLIIKAVYPFSDDEFNSFFLGTVLFLPPILFNYLVIYHKKGYKMILKENAHLKRGSFKHFALYLLFSISALGASVFLYNAK